MVIQIQIQDDTWKLLNKLKQPGQTFDDVINQNLNQKRRQINDKPIEMDDMEIPEQNSRFNTKVLDNIKKEKDSSQELPEPLVLGIKD